MRAHLFWTTACLLALSVDARAQTDAVRAQCPLWDDLEVTETTRVDDAACAYLVRIPDDVYDTRSFRLLVPDSYAPNAGGTRLVVDFHGTFASKSNQMRNSCWRQKAIEVGAVVAYPNGTGFPRSFSAGDYCCQTKIGPATDDVAFTRRVVDKAKDMLAAARYHIYASGLSNGGAMSHELACEATDVFDGIAAVSQTFTKLPGTVCIDDSETPVPVLDFRGRHDDVIPYDGGTSWKTLFVQDWLSAAESLARWQEELECSGGERTRTSFDPDDNTYCDRVHGCLAPLVQCTLDTGHVLYDDARLFGLDICDAAWEFWGEQEGQLLPAP